MNLISYIPPIFAHLKFIKSLEINLYAYMGSAAKKLSEADETVQKLFNEIVCECRLKKGLYSCKIGKPSNGSSASVIDYRTVCLSEELASDLKSNNEKKQLCARSIIKHELGHIENRDNASLIAIAAIQLGCIYAFNHLFTYLPEQTIVYAVGTVAAIYFQFRFLYDTDQYFEKWAELRADAFSIRHATTAKELSAVAEFFEDKFEDVVANAPNTYLGGVKLTDIYDRKKKENQTLRDWLIENRNVPNLIHQSTCHPNPYDRAKTFREASKKF